MNISNTRYHSKKIGEIADGCKQCVQGRKLVLFVTGICSRNCWFCPLSEQKMKKDVIYANEWKLDDENDTKKILEEARLCASYGAGITGGDPLLKIERTAKYIKLLKKNFGKKFHIHLYTPLNNISKKRLDILYKSGLDEIRIHPDFFDRTHWKNALLLKSYDWDIGMEIPVIPGYEKKTLEMINHFASMLKFLNLNELEISETNLDAMLKRKYKTKSELSYAVKGSEEMGVKLMKHCIKHYPKLNVHFCTTKLKDAVQLANRLKLRAERASTKFDRVTKEGMLVRNCLYLDDLKPGFGYRKLLNKVLDDKKLQRQYAVRLNKIKKNLSGKKIPCMVDTLKYRILVRKQDLKRISISGTSMAEVEEYPTSDGMELSVRFI